MPNTLNDDEFKRQLKKNHTKKIITRTVSLVLIIGGIIMMILFNLWFFDMRAGFFTVIVGLIFLLLSSFSYSTDKKSIIDSFMKDYEELADYEYFGRNLASPGHEIDYDYLVKNNPTDKKWDEAIINNNYEGYSSGIHFTAANVELISDREFLNVSDDGTTNAKRYDAFSGVYIVIETKKKADSDFLFYFNKSVGGDRNPLKDGDLSKYYTVSADNPEFGLEFAARYEKCLRRLYKENDYTPHILYRGNKLHIGIPTFGRFFRAINGRPDINDIESFRTSYRDSLEYVRKTINIIKEETDLLDAEE